MNGTSNGREAETPPRPDPAPRPPSLRWLGWTVGVVNAVLAGLLLAGWVGRPAGCAGGCPIEIPVRWLVIVLLLADVGLLLALTSLAYGRLVRLGARLGGRLKERRGSR
jgi:hypothetical protein